MLIEHGRIFDALCYGTMTEEEADKEYVEYYEALKKEKDENPEKFV